MAGLGLGHRWRVGVGVRVGVIFRVRVGVRGVDCVRESGLTLTLTVLVLRRSYV